MTVRNTVVIRCQAMNTFVHFYVVSAVGEF